MKRQLFRTMFLLIGLLTVSVVPSLAQSNVQITSFTTTATQVGRTALANRTARIPVSWTTANRPLTANLIFEQILPDGSSINVELPRVIPFVASAGDGIAAPILPTGEVTSIRLRVRLVNLFTQFVYDTKEITLSLVDGNSGSGGTGAVPAITSYTVRYSAPINRAELDNGTVRLPVSWVAINRPTWMNLIFEQVLPNGTVVNVELPRPFQWVNSADNGMVAPVSVGAGATQITLRIRLADFFGDRTYDQLYAYIPIQSAENAPDITNFSTTTTSISANIVRGGNARIDVGWAVSNRYNGTNFVFEQILPDGSVRNAELPRDVLIVPSTGYGVVAPILPTQATNQLVFRLRVVDLSNNSTLDTEQLTVNLTDNPQGERVYVTGNACYQAPFPPDNGVSINGQARVQARDNTDVVSFFDDITYIRGITGLEVGAVFNVNDGPRCSYIPGNPQTASRQWIIERDGLTGNIPEFSVNTDGSFAYYFIPTSHNDIPTVQVNAFTVSPSTVSAADIANTTFTLTWQTQNASNLTASYVNSIAKSKYNSGTATVNGSSVGTNSGEIRFFLDARDTQNNLVSTEFNVTVETSASINSFTVTPETATANQQVTFSWDIEGDFDGGSLNFWDNQHGYNHATLQAITSNTGTFTYTLPETLVGDYVFELDVVDNAGVTISEQVTVTVNCAYQWGFTVSETLCPQTDLINRTGAFQAFQRGFMIWLPTDAASIWVFYNDGTAARYNDSWDGSDYTIDGTPPDGTFAPERGFGYIWNTVPAVRSGLGWATGAEEGYTVMYQATSNATNAGSFAYIQRPNGQLIRLYRTTANGTILWENKN